MNISPIAGVLLFAGLAGVVAASVTDFKDRIIHNEVVIYTLVVGIALRLVSTPGLLWLSLAGAVVLFIVLGSLAHHDFIGGGDAKLIAAATLLAPAPLAAQLMVDIAIAGGLLSVAYFFGRLALRKAALERSVAGASHSDGERRGPIQSEFDKILAGEPMPYALAILGGTAYFIVSEVRECLSAISCSL